MKIIIIGGPRSGKSTFAAKYAAKMNIPHYCTDPISLVKDLQKNTKYLPDGIKWGDDSQYIIDNWISKQESFIIEGVGSVRALRKLTNHKSIDKIIVFKEVFPGNELLPGQASMYKSIMTIWDQIKDNYKDITIYA